MNDWLWWIGFCMVLSPMFAIVPIVYHMEKGHSVKSDDKLGEV